MRVQQRKRGKACTADKAAKESSASTCKQSNERNAREARKASKVKPRKAQHTVLVGFAISHQSRECHRPIHVDC